MKVNLPATPDPFIGWIPHAEVGGGESGGEGPGEHGGAGGVGTEGSGGESGGEGAGRDESSGEHGGGRERRGGG